MPEIVFDGKKLAVAAGTNLVDAGLEAGVPVPVFCYHKDLGAVGSCRVCAVHRDPGRQEPARHGVHDRGAGRHGGHHARSGIDRASQVRARVADGEPSARLPDLRRGRRVPAPGPDHRRRSRHPRATKGPKRTFRNQYLGEFIQHEMNRCITCYRCSRFYQEYAGRTRLRRHREPRPRVLRPLRGGAAREPVLGQPGRALPDRRVHRQAVPLPLAGLGPRDRSVGVPALLGRLQRPSRGAASRAAAGAGAREPGGERGVPVRPRPVRPRLRHGSGAPARDPAPRSRRASWEEALGLAGGALPAIAREHGAAERRRSWHRRAPRSRPTLALESLATGPLEGARVGHFDESGAGVPRPGGARARSRAPARCRSSKATSPTATCSSSPAPRWWTRRRWRPSRRARRRGGERGSSCSGRASITSTTSPSAPRPCTRRGSARAWRPWRAGSAGPAPPRKSRFSPTT